MATNGLLTAVTLYRCGTLTLTQAASHAGRNTDAFARTLEQHGISPQSPPLADEPAPPRRH